MVQKTEILSILGITGYLLIALSAPSAIITEINAAGIYQPAQERIMGSSLILNNSTSSQIIPNKTASLPESIPTHKPYLVWNNQDKSKSHITGNPDLLLPDLQTLPPSNLIIRTNPSSGQKTLRFTNSIINLGPGPLELLGVSNPETRTTSVTQQIYSLDGTTVQRSVSEFIFHQGHDHWHFENFARYELWSLSSDWRPHTLVSLSDKVSFCLRDIERSHLPEGNARARFTRCGREMQGISPGWIDTYRYYYDGQYLDITTVPDGYYILRSVADPDNQLLDVDDSNNDAALYIEISGTHVHIIEDAKELEAIDKYRRLK